MNGAHPLKAVESFPQYKSTFLREDYTLIVPNKSGSAID